MSNMSGVTSAIRRRLPYKVSHLQRLDKGGDSGNHSLEMCLFMMAAISTPILYYFVTQPVNAMHPASGVCAGGVQPNLK